MTVGVEVEPFDINGRPMWRRVSDGRRIALLAPAGLGGEGLRVYRRRWAIATMFHVWALDRGRPRPQTIQAHVIQFSLHVLANTIGACTRFAIEHGDSNPGPGTTTTFVSIVQVLVEVAIEPG